jgi:hypothetical protein
MDSDTEDNPNIEEIIHNEPIMEGGFSAEDEYYKSIMEGGFDDDYSDEDDSDSRDDSNGIMDGGATPKYSHINPSSSSILLSEKYLTRMDDYGNGNRAVILAPRDLLVLAARIKPYREDVAINNAENKYDNINFKHEIIYEGFFSIYYKTMYHLRMLIIEIERQKSNNGINNTTNNTLNFNKNPKSKIETQFLNSQFIKSSKYNDSTYVTGGYLGDYEIKAKYLTELCSKSQTTDAKQTPVLRKSGRTYKHGYIKKSYKKKAREQAANLSTTVFVSNIQSTFESINHIQGNLKKNYTPNRLKCILYYIRYHQVAFNYYFEQLLKVYKNILAIDDRNAGIINDVNNRKDEYKRLTKLFSGDNNPYNELLSVINNLLKKNETTTTQYSQLQGSTGNDFASLNNNTIAIELGKQQIGDTNSVFKNIMNEISSSQPNSSILNSYAVNNDYIYLFIYFTYITKYAIVDPKFFNINANLIQNLSKQRKSSNSIKKPDGKLSTGSRLIILLASIPNCMKILINDLVYYKNILTEFRQQTGITHLGNIIPDMYGIKNVFSKITSKTKIKKMMEKDMTGDEKRALMVKEFVTIPTIKPDKLDDEKYRNNIIFASYVVDCLIMKLFANYIYGGKQSDIDDSLKSIYNRLLSSSINESTEYDINSTLDVLRNNVDAVVKNYSSDANILTGKMMNDAYNLFTKENDDADARKQNVNECFDKLYEYAIELLLNTPIIIYKYKKLGAIRKAIWSFNNPKDKGWYTAWLRNHPNINKDIASMSRNAIRTFTNLIVGIELGIYDFEKNITFTKNSESVYSSLPLYFENLFRSAIYSNRSTSGGAGTHSSTSSTTTSAKQPEYLLSSKMYDTIDISNNISKIALQNSSDLVLTSLEASTLSLEELINIWYAKLYEAKRRTLIPLKGGADGAIIESEKTEEAEGTKTVKKPVDAKGDLAELAELFGSLSSQTGGSKKQRNVIGKILKENKKLQKVDRAYNKAIRKEIGVWDWKNPRRPDVTELAEGKQREYAQKKGSSYGEIYKKKKDGSEITFKDKYAELEGKRKDTIATERYSKNYVSLSDKDKAEVDFLLKDKDMFAYLNYMLSVDKIIGSQVNTEITQSINSLPNGDTELANVLLTKNFSYLYDMAFINKSEQDTDRNGIKLTRNLLIKTIYKKIEFMKARLKQLMLDTPDINSDSNIYTYRKIYKITLSKAMILVKMKQYVDDISEIITKSKIIEASSETNNTATISKYNDVYFNKFLANLALNNAKIAIDLAGGSKKLYDFSIDNPVVVSPDDLKRLLKIIDPTFKMIVEKEYDKLTEEQQLYRVEEFKKIKGLINNIKDTIAFKNGSNNEIEFPRVEEDVSKNVKFSEKLIADVNGLANDGGDNPIKTALKHFWNADANVNPNAMKAVKNDMTEPQEPSDGTHKWHFALQSNIAKIREYFLDNANSVFANKDTAAIDPVLMYKINMRVLEEYNKAMKYCIDNFLKMADNGNGFIEGDKDENVPTNFSVVLGELVKILNRLARGDNKEDAIDNASDIIEFDPNIDSDYQKTLCKQLSEYYLMVSVIRCIEYMFQVLTIYNEGLIKKEQFPRVTQLRADITNGNYQEAITTKLGEINTTVSNAAKQASEKAKQDSEKAKKDSVDAEQKHTAASRAYETAKQAYDTAKNAYDAVDIGAADAAIGAADTAIGAADADATKAADAAKAVDAAAKAVDDAIGKIDINSINTAVKKAEDAVAAINPIVAGGGKGDKPEVADPAAVGVGDGDDDGDGDGDAEGAAVGDAGKPDAGSVVDGNVSDNENDNVFKYMDIFNRKNDDEGDAPPDAAKPVAVAAKPPAAVAKPPAAVAKPADNAVAKAKAELEAAKKALGDAIKELAQSKKTLEEKKKALDELNQRLQAVKAVVDDLKEEAEKATAQAKSINAVQAIIGADGNNNTLKGVAIADFGGTDFSTGNTEVVGKLITDVQHAETQLELAIANLFSAIVAKMKTENDTNNIQNAKDYAITIKKVLSDIVTDVNNAGTTKAAFTAGYGVYSAPNVDIGDPVKTALNECLYVAVAIAGLRMINGAGNGKLFDTVANKYDEVTIKDEVLPGADANLDGFTLAHMQNIIKYISFQIENKIDSEVFTQLGVAVKTTANGIVDGSNIIVNGKKISITSDMPYIDVNPDSSNIDNFKLIFGYIDDGTEGDAKDVDFIKDIVNAILELPAIASEVQAYKIENMTNDLMKNVLQFTRYIYPSIVNDDGQRMITFKVDNYASDDFKIEDDKVKPKEDVDLLFDKYRIDFSNYIQALRTRQNATIYDRFNMVFMVNYVASDITGFINSLKMLGVEPIPAGRSYSLNDGNAAIVTENHPNIGVIIELDYDTGYIVNNQYLAISFEPDKLPESIAPTENPGDKPPKVESRVRITTAIEYAKNNNMLWIKSGNNGVAACWINAALTALLADTRITYLPETYDSSKPTNEDVFNSPIQNNILDMLKAYATNNTKTLWTKDKYNELLKLLQDNVKMDSKVTGDTYSQAGTLLPGTTLNEMKNDFNNAATTTTDSYNDVRPIVSLLSYVLQKGFIHASRGNSRFQPELYTSMSIHPNQKLSDILDGKYDDFIKKYNKNYTLLSLIVSTQCSTGEDYHHFRSFAKIYDDNNNYDDLWIEHDLIKDPISSIKNTKYVDDAIKCSGGAKKPVIAIYIRNDAYTDVKAAAAGLAGGGLQLTSSKTKKNSKKRATLTGKRKAVRNHSSYNNMYKGARKSLMGNAKNKNKNRSLKTKKAAKRYTKTGKRD